MKWKGSKSNSEFLPEKTFLIIKDNPESLTIKRSKRWAKSKSATDTGTWPPKVKKLCPYSDEERPKTANLEKPSVLDPSLLNKLDMSLLSKELLSDSMTRIQLGVRKLGGGMASSNRRGVQQTVSDKRSETLNGVEPKISCTRYKRRSFDHLTTVDHQLINTDTLFESITMKKQLTSSPSIHLNDRILKKRNLELKKLDDNNNKNTITTMTTTIGTNKPVTSLSTVRVIKSSRSAISSEIEVFTNSPNKFAPEPCKTCGRPDQPERFHSHPKGITSMKFSNKDDNGNKIKDPEKKSIQKPIALNFHSEKNKIKNESIIDSTGKQTNILSPKSRPSSVKKGPKTVTCYICAREFFTASFPIHEPKCMEKWERENNALPSSQRRPVPQRPIVSVDDREWNTVAWEQSQMQLVPCVKCKRTFTPDRLTVHEKTCKATPKKIVSSLDKLSKSKSVLNHSIDEKTICQTCGKSFNNGSIKLHEQQCSKKSPNENNIWANTQKNNTSIKLTSPMRDILSKPTTTCYICGRDFGSASIDIHEPQCLKKWHIENAKLPLNQRRIEPQKPEVIYRESSTSPGKEIDWAATSEARWRSHLGQLVPCKFCKRTFNPDRVSIHERNCKGSH